MSNNTFLSCIESSRMLHDTVNKHWLASEQSGMAAACARARAGRTINFAFIKQISALHPYFHSMMHRAQRRVQPLSFIALAVIITLFSQSCRMPENTRRETAPDAASRANQTADRHAVSSPPGASPEASATTGEQADEQALELHRRAIAIDMHADTVQFMLDDGADINRRLDTTHLDAPRMREGGLDAQFFSIWVEPEYYGERGARAVARADAQIARVRALAEEHPETWVLATTAADIRRSAAEGKLAALLGLEGGYALDERLEQVERYYQMGVRYLSPTWTRSTSWAGSSGDAAGATRGLNDFGRSVIREMNRLGIMVDVSHVSDQTFWDIIRTSVKPVIATHSNARSLCDAPRNLTDEMIRALAGTGGVVCVVFYPAFLEAGWREQKERLDREIAAEVSAASRQAKGHASQKRLARDRVRERFYAERLPRISVSRVVDHIDHIVRLVGIEHVGVGSDFDGIQATPAGLADVSELPNLTRELLRRGYTPEEVMKILGGNILRVMEEVEKH